MKSIKAYLMVWFAGLIAGFILMERWQRTSGLPVRTAADAGATSETDAAATVSGDQPKVAAVVVAGAKADAERARQMLERMSPWGSSSPCPGQAAPCGSNGHAGGHSHRPGIGPWSGCGGHGV